MQEANLIEIFTAPLTASGLRYCITGSVAAMLYGEPRLTQDIDLVIEVDCVEHARALGALFPAEHFYVPPEEVIRIEASRERRGHFNIIHLDSGYKADLYLKGEDPFHDWALQNAHAVQLSGRAIPVAPPEYVIVRKLQYFKEGGSEKHVRDIKAIMRNPSLQLNQTELDRWLEIGGVTAEWRKIVGG